MAHNKDLISISLSPNLERDDTRIAIRSMFSFSGKKKGEYPEKIHTIFTRKYNTDFVATFNAGRSGLYCVLQAFGIHKNDEVLLQAFTCVAVPNCVLWVGATPIYVDIDETYNIDIIDAEKKITSKTKAIIIQHTFGFPAKLDQLIKFAQKYKLILIEDCAHSLDVSYKNKPLGSYGDAAFFSFGRDKAISSVFGGCAIIHKKHKKVGKNFLANYEKLKYPSSFWIYQQLFHSIIFPLIKSTYSIILGKLLLKLFQTINLLSFPVEQMEKFGEKPSIYPSRLPNSLAEIALNQLLKLKKFTQRRIYSQLMYNKLIISLGINQRDYTDENPIFLRYPLPVKSPLVLRKFLMHRNIQIGKWYESVIDPVGVDLRLLNYTPGSCPNAESKAGHIVNLPTNITKGEVSRMCAALKQFFTIYDSY